MTTQTPTPAMGRDPSLEAAYAVCARFAREHYENFPVASRLLPAAMRPHVAAVYAFARIADDFADEGQRPGEERLALLNAWSGRLRESKGGALPYEDVGEAHGADADNLPRDLPRETPAVFAAVRATIRSCDLPVSLFEDLLSAFRQDVTTHRYATWDAVLDYCRRSANPVGRLVLRIAGYRDAALDRSSDAVCTALQLTNFWQDLERDWMKGRLYLPLDWCRETGARFEDLDARRASDEWRQVLRRAGAATSELFEEGRHVCSAVRGRLGVELRLTWLGGRRILDRLERIDFDVFGRRPTLGAADAPMLLWQLAGWRRA